MKSDRTLLQDVLNYTIHSREVGSAGTHAFTGQHSDMPISIQDVVVFALKKRGAVCVDASLFA
jgi:hypothetical protein